MDEQKFHLGDLLSVTGKKLVSPDKMRGVENLIAFVIGEPVWWGAGIMPQANVCKLHLLTVYPWLADIDDSSVNGDNWRVWLDEQVAKYGEYHVVTPMDTPFNILA